MRCSVSPLARASFVCMSMQKAQPLICDARVLTSSINDFSSPHSSTYFCNEYIARKAPGAAFSYFKCVPICFSFISIYCKFVSYCDHVCGGRKVTATRKFSSHAQCAVRIGLNLRGDEEGDEPNPVTSLSTARPSSRSRPTNSANEYFHWRCADCCRDWRWECRRMASSGFQ